MARTKGGRKPKATTTAASDSPGDGWSNGDIPPLFAQTQQGRLEQYSHHRRWLQLKGGWSRIGAGQSQYAHRTTTSSSNDDDDANALAAIDPVEQARTIRALIAQLCEQFYRFGWATGTGGGISIRAKGPDDKWRVFVAPSGIQKEDMIGEDVFELDMDRNVVQAPETPNLKQSACTPLWYVVYRLRPTARAVIHTHSMYAQLATLLDPTETSDVLRLTHLEMLKGVGGHGYDDVLEIPIIDNRPSEDLLASQLEKAVEKYPKCNAVLVRRHGVYVWGDSWEQAKTQCESFDYLFQSAIELKRMGIDIGKMPASGTYREEDGDKEGSEKKRAVADVDDEQSDVPPSKKVKTDTNGFNGISGSENMADLTSNSVPIFPRDGKILLLDIEGCTTSIAFVKEVLFPYVLEHIQSHLEQLGDDACKDLATKLATDLASPAATTSLSPEKVDLLSSLDKTSCSAMVEFMVKEDLKLSSLKLLQGDMWKSGYENGSLKGHVYDDTVAMFQWMSEHGVDVYIYSSGSIAAQKLLFGNSTKGDLLPHLKGHFDITTSGNKKVSSSYTNIAASIGVPPGDICFVSDSEAELEAAAEAGIGHTIMSIRPQNAPLTEVGKKYPSVLSLLQLCGA